MEQCFIKGNSFLFKYFLCVSTSFETESLTRTITRSFRIIKYG